MTDEAAPLEYAAALAEAQRLGYAEADPAGDVEGHDAVNKLVILARLAFDRWLDPAAIATRPDGADGPAGPGITTVSLADQADARAAGRIIRLLASASIDDAGTIAAAVLPTALPLESALGRTAGVRNRIEIDAPAGRARRLRRSRARAAPRRRRRCSATSRHRPRGRLDLGSPAAGGRPDRRSRAPARRRGPRRPRAASGTRSMTDRTSSRRSPGRGSSSATARSCRSPTRRRR